VLGDLGEALMPRPPSPVERAFVGLAIADALERGGVDATIEWLAEIPAMDGAVLCELTVAAPVASALVVAIPPLCSAPVRALATRISTRGARLPAVSAVLELASGTWHEGLAALNDLGVRDVVVVGPADGMLRIADGGIPVTLDLGGARVIVRGLYQRLNAMSPVPDDHDDQERLGDDLRVPLTIVIADVSVSARQLLELCPGQVLATRRPVGTTVELRAGRRLIARGELVTIEGDLGVRVTEIAGADSPPGLSASTAHGSSGAR
jgi:flagellar motor switch/type III secretory pathway protein FliN